MHDVAAGLSYLHFRSTIHGDIKSPNILLTVDSKAKIADFGRPSKSYVRALHAINRKKYSAPQQSALACA